MTDKPLPLAEGLFYDRAKLLIMVNLMSAKSALSFLELTEATQLTKGNLSSHLQKLELQKLVKITKEFVDKKPLTTIEVTSRGKKAFKEHLDEMQNLIKRTKF